MSASISAVIFDLDGLLLDSEPIQLLAWETYLAGHGQQLHEELLARMYGRRLVDAAREVAETLQLPVDAATIAAERDALFMELVPGAIQPMPGAIALLRRLVSLPIGLALATSGHRSYVELALATAGVPRVFDIEVTGDLVEHGKPAPDTFLTAAQLLGLPPSACLVLEDSPNGVRAAYAAGARCFAVRHIASDEELLESGAERVLDSLDDVWPIIEREL